VAVTRDMDRRTAVALAAAVGLVVLALVVFQFGFWLAFVDPGEYDRTTVGITDESGDHLGTVDVRVADTATKRAIGLSRTDALGPDEGMLFVHEAEGRHRYVMRDMAFGLDIVFVDANGTITEIHHADPAGPITPELLLTRYAGEGRYVLEVTRGWTNETGVEVGDRVDVTGALDGDGAGADDAARDEPTVTPRPDLQTVRAVDRNGTALGEVGVWIADTGDERYTGLSERPALHPEEGMLFVYEEEDARTFVMRNMSFPLDMIFVAGNGTVTTIHHAAVGAPDTEESELRRYRGRAQYVLEVNRGWANETGLDVGDEIRVPTGARSELSNG